MTRSILLTSVVCLLLPQQSEANDIVDFLRAISGPSPRTHVGYGHEVGRHDFRTVSRRPVERRTRLAQSAHLGAQHPHLSPAVDPRALRSRSRASGLRSSGLSFQVSIGNNSPVVPRYVSSQQFRQLPAPPLPGTPLPGQFGHLPHELGQIVTCPVPIFNRVHVESACRIAPNAVPTLVAVRDPNLGRFRSCVEQMVYVEVLVPPCPPRRVRVSPCRTRIRMDYGRYDVTIESRNGCVTVEYDN